MDRRSSPAGSLARLSILCAVFALLALPAAHAGAGIRGPSPESLSFYSEPNKVFEASFYIYGAPRLTSFIEGDLAQYAQIHDSGQNGSERAISVILHLPERLPAGPHELFVGVREIPENPDFLGGVAAARRRISVMALYDEPLLAVSSFMIPSIAVNTSANNATVTVSSLTLRHLSGVAADIKIYADDGRLLLERRTNSVDLPSGASATMRTSFPTLEFTPGPYRGVAVVRYGPNMTEAETAFRVGTLDFFLESYSPNLTVDTINRFAISVRSNWNQPVDDVHAQIKLGALSEETPSSAVGPFGVLELKTYLDTHGLPLGPVDGTVTVVHPGGSKAFPIRVTIVNVTVPEVKPTEAEMQQAQGFRLAPVHFYIATIAVLVALVLVLLFRRRSGDSGALEPPRV